MPHDFMPRNGSSKLFVRFWSLEHSQPHVLWQIERFGGGTARGKQYRSCFPRNFSTLRVPRRGARFDRSLSRPKKNSAPISNSAVVTVFGARLHGMRRYQKGKRKRADDGEAADEAAQVGRTALPNEIILPRQRPPAECLAYYCAMRGVLYDDVPRKKARS